MALRILVTGASGFIGKALVHELAAAGHNVRAAARVRLVSTSQNVEYMTLPDITRPIDWAPLLVGVDIVVHLAGIAHRQGGEGVNYDQANRGAVADLAATCRNASIQKLIFMSSIGAMTGSAADHVVAEVDVPHPVTAYDHAKLSAEEAIREAGVPHTILRPVIVYGPEPKANVRLLAKLLALPLPLPFGSFTNRRSLLAVDNLTSAVCHCLNDPRTLNQTYIVADPVSFTLVEILSTMRRAIGRRPLLIPIPMVVLRWLISLSGQKDLWQRVGRDLVVSPQKLIRAGWLPKARTEDGLSDMMRNWNASHKSWNRK